MNKIFTLFVMGLICLFANTASAQINENFEGSLANCWLRENTSNVTFSNTGNKAIGFSNNANASKLATPYITFTSGTVNIQFVYRLSTSAHQNKRRTLQVGYQDVNGNFYPFHNAIKVTTESFINFEVNNSNTFSMPDGSYRIAIRAAGDGANEYVIVDNVVISGGVYHYENVCNAIPQINADSYTATGYNIHTFTTSVLANDSDADIAETLTASVLQQSADGTVVMNADGTFTFKPNIGFTGTSTTFIYSAIDNGYEPIARTATVTINFIEPVILPVRFTSFSGSTENNKASLSWNVADNETGNHFEVEKSTDGRSFKTIATVLCSNTSGAEKYTFDDAGFNSNGTYYRIKVINKDQTTSYSKILFIKSTTSSNSQLTLLQNPTTSSVTFNYQAVGNGTAEVRIFNVAGSIMHTQKLVVNRGNNTVNIPLNGQYIKGYYILEVVTPGSKSSTRFVKL